MSRPPAATTELTYTTDFTLHQLRHERCLASQGLRTFNDGSDLRAPHEERVAVTRLRTLWESVRTTYWAVPSLMAVIAAGLSIAMIRVDEALTPQFIGTLPWVYTGGPEGARAVLSTIAGSMMTVAGVTFSITIVALTLASQQFGPRLLRNFLRDLGNQIVLGTFVSTFLYCLLVLRTIRGTDDAQFVPHVAVTLGVALATLSLGVLIFFIHHVSTTIQASEIIAKVATDLEAAVLRLFPEQLGRGSDLNGATEGPPLGFRRDGHTVTATRSGYIQAVDGQALLTLATERDLVLRIDAAPGSFVRHGSALVMVWPQETPDDDLGQSVRTAFIVGSARTPTQDVEFFAGQLVELAVRALSPGINDPATARMCLDRLGQALCQMATREVPASRRYDDGGRLRVVARPVSFEKMAATAFDEIRRYGRSSVSVTVHMLEVIRDIAECVERDADRSTLLTQAHVILQDSREADLSAEDRTRIEKSHRTAVAALQNSPLQNSPA